MKTTIREVARRAGVSISTVSRVFNKTAFVEESTSEKVRSAALELRYAPNQAARSLVKNETRTIGLILPSVFGEYYSEVLSGMDSIASAADYDIMLSGSKSIGSKFEKSIRAMSGRVDGLIIMSPTIGSEQLRTLIPQHLRTVLMNTADTSGSFATVSVDNRGGAMLAVKHLIALGHQRIAHIRGHDGSDDARLRAEGYRAAMQDAGLERFITEVSGSFTIKSGETAMRAVLALPERPTGVFAANDAMAIGALTTLADEGVVVPDGIALVAFDDLPRAQSTRPPLTTIRVDLAAFGATAMQEVIASIQQGSNTAPVHRTIASALIVRESCGARRH
jgi:LacI family transcriptional regulator